MPFAPDTAALRPVTGPAAPTPDAQRVSAQAIRFLVVGGVATVVDVGLFNLLHFGAGADPLSAKAASTVVAGVVAFLGNREFSFGDQRGRSVRRQVVAFTLVSVVALLVNLLVIAGAGVLGLHSAVELNAAANVVGLGLATAVRFYGCRRWVFPPADELAPEPADVPVAEPLAA